MSDRDLRLEKRLPKAEPVHLLGLSPPGVSESTYTQNISVQGVRVLTNRIWAPGTTLRIKSLRGDFVASASVVYWRSFGSRMAIGLRFQSVQGAWS